VLSVRSLAHIFPLVVRTHAGLLWTPKGAQQERRLVFPLFFKRQADFCIRSNDMRKQTEYKIADTNLALFGTPLEKEVKLAAALCDPEWKAMHEVKPAVGFHVWRVEKFAVKKWPK
jgi:hypothetical protein